MSLEQEKNVLRKAIQAKRDATVDREKLSLDISLRLQQFPPFQRAQAVAFYVHVRSEVSTRRSIAQRFQAGKQVVVPKVAGKNLELYIIEDFHELEPGAFGVLEPTQAVCNWPYRRVAVDLIDMIVVPGMVFDQKGGRIGYGGGYYDRLLASASVASAVALAFECQIVSQVPNAEHDQFVDAVITEKRVVDCRGNREI